jgi:hypothetical protein
MKSKKKKYGTEEQKIKTLKKRGNIITFKEPFSWKGEKFMHIMVQEIEKEKGSVKIIGFSRDTRWYDTMKDLINAVNWDLMEQWHSS